MRQEEPAEEGGLTSSKLVRLGFPRRVSSFWLSWKFDTNLLARDYLAKATGSAGVSARDRGVDSSLYGPGLVIRQHCRIPIYVDPWNEANRASSLQKPPKRALDSSTNIHQRTCLSCFYLQLSCLISNNVRRLQYRACRPRHRRQVVAPLQRRDPEAAPRGEPGLG